MNLDYFYLIVAGLNFSFFPYFRAKHELNIRKFLLPFFEIIVAVSFILMVVSAIYSLFHYGFYGRMFNIWNASHALSYLAIFSTAVITGLVKKDFIMSYFLTGTLIAFHELTWYVIYPFFYGLSFNDFVYYLPFQIVLFSFVYVDLKYIHFKGIKVAFLIVLAIYALWVFTGFPVTLDYSGKTAWYYSPYVNNIEILSWVLMGIINLALGLINRKIKNEI